jgi:methyl-accepting chemotaxis protein
MAPCPAAVPPDQANDGRHGHLAGGYLEASLPAAEGNDEVSGMARALIVLRDNAITARRIETEQAEAQSLKAAREQQLERLTEGFEVAVGTVVRQLAAAANEMSTAAETMAISTEEANRRSIAVASASQEASCNTGAVASATEQLVASIAGIAQRVDRAARVAQYADQAASKTRSIVGDLLQSARKIGPRHK